MISAGVLISLSITGVKTTPKTVMIRPDSRPNARSVWIAF